jgi:nicotinamide mononucleotide (NMN) deamidase PncC
LQNAKAVGLDDETADKSTEASLQISDALLKAGMVKAKSALAVPDTGLVGADGQPLTVKT